MPEALAELAALKESSARLEAFFSRINGIFSPAGSVAMKTTVSPLVSGFDVDVMVPVGTSRATRLPSAPGVPTMVDKVKAILRESGTHMMPAQIVAAYKEKYDPFPPDIKGKVNFTLKYLRQVGKLDHVEGVGYRLPAAIPLATNGSKAESMV